MAMVRHKKKMTVTIALHHCRPHSSTSQVVLLQNLIGYKLVLPYQMPSQFCLVSLPCPPKLLHPLTRERYALCTRSYACFVQPSQP